MRTASTLLLSLALLLAAARPVRAGYTHHWTWRSAPDPAALASCLADMRRIADASTDIATRADCEEPNDSSAICFNGIGDDSHESFIFPGTTSATPADPDGAFNSCKTGGGAPKPYDRVVTACLIAARDHFPPTALDISSDGEWSDWRDGARLYERALGRTASSPFSEVAEFPEEWDAADGTSSHASGITTILCIAGVAILLFAVLHRRTVFVVSMRASEVTFHGAFPPARRAEMTALLRGIVPADGRVTVKAHRRSDGRLDHAISGDIDDGGRQRIVNFLVNSPDISNAGRASEPRLG